MVQSRRPLVPSAQPSQTPRERTLQAWRRLSLFSQAIRSILEKWCGLVSPRPKGMGL